MNPEELELVRTAAKSLREIRPDGREANVRAATADLLDRCAELNVCGEQALKVANEVAWYLAN